jgi:hypothetical protein
MSKSTYIKVTFNIQIRYTCTLMVFNNVQYYEHRFFENVHWATKQITRLAFEMTYITQLIT